MAEAELDDDQGHPEVATAQDDVRSSDDDGVERSATTSTAAIAVAVSPENDSTQLFSIDDESTSEDGMDVQPIVDDDSEKSGASGTAVESSAASGTGPLSQHKHKMGEQTEQRAA